MLPSTSQSSRHKWNRTASIVPASAYSSTLPSSAFTICKKWWCVLRSRSSLYCLVFGLCAAFTFICNAHWQVWASVPGPREHFLSLGDLKGMWDRGIIYGIPPAIKRTSQVWESQYLPPEDGSGLLRNVSVRRHGVLFGKVKHFSSIRLLGRTPCRWHSFCRRPPSQRSDVSQLYVLPFTTMRNGCYVNRFFGVYLSNTCCGAVQEHQTTRLPLLQPVYLHRLTHTF